MWLAPSSCFSSGSIKTTILAIVSSIAVLFVLLDVWNITNASHAQEAIRTTTSVSLRVQEEQRYRSTILTNRSSSNNTIPIDHKDTATASDTAHDIVIDDINDDTERQFLRHNLELIRPRPRNMTLIMIGDSLMRYQYMSLAYFLRFGRWYDTQASTTVSYLLHSNSWRHPRYPTDSWNEYFLQSNRILQPMEVCDCFRNRAIILERRYFYDKERNNRLVFLNLNGKEGTQAGHKTFLGRLILTNATHSNASDIFDNFEQYLTKPWVAQPTDLTSYQLTWEYKTWGDVLRYHVTGLLEQQHQPVRYDTLNSSDHSSSHSNHSASVSSTGDAATGTTTINAILLNAGRHSHDFEHSWARDDLLRALNSTPALRSAKVLWKTTTMGYDELKHAQKRQKRVPRRSSDELMCTALSNAKDDPKGGGEACFDISWLQDIRSTLYVDKTHHMEPIYRILNEELMTKIGVLPQGYQKLNRSVVMDRNVLFQNADDRHRRG